MEFTFTIDGQQRTWKPMRWRAPEIAKALRIFRADPDAFQGKVRPFMKRLELVALPGDIRQAVREVLRISLPADLSFPEVLGFLSAAMESIVGERCPA